MKFPLAIFVRMVYSWGVRVAALTPAGLPFNQCVGYQTDNVND